MSQREEWKKSIKNKIKKREEFIGNVKELSDLAAEANEQNKEDEAKLLFVENMPESLLAERGQSLFLFEKHQEEQLGRYLPGLSHVTSEARKYINISGTSSSSAYMEIVQTYRLSDEVSIPFNGDAFSINAEPVEIVYTAFADLAEAKSKKTNLPPRLNKINQNLGEMFTIATQNYQKAQIGLMLVHQSAMDLRAVLQQVWGGLVALARKKDSRNLKNHTESRKESDRIIVAECLIADEVERKILITSLDNLAKLYSDLSEGNFGKNVLGDDKVKLNGLYKLWILTISDIVNSIFSNIEFSE